MTILFQAFHMFHLFQLFQALHLFQVFHRNKQNWQNETLTDKVDDIAIKGLMSAKWKL